MGERGVRLSLRVRDPRYHNVRVETFERVNIYFINNPNRQGFVPRA